MNTRVGRFSGEEQPTLRPGPIIYARGGMSLKKLPGERWKHTPALLHRLLCCILGKLECLRMGALLIASLRMRKAAARTGEREDRPETGDVGG